MKITNEEGKSITPAMAETIKRRIDDEEEAEQARVLYVALTRARDYLVLCGKEDPKDSWFGLFDAVFEVATRPDGARIQGKHWQGTVRKPALLPYGRAPQASVREMPPHDQLSRRIAPIAAAHPNRITFSISAILDHQAGGFDEHEEREAEERPAKNSNAWARTRGTLVHRIFELWNFRSDALPPLDSLLPRPGWDCVSVRRSVKIWRHS